MLTARLGGIEIGLNGLQHTYQEYTVSFKGKNTMSLLLWSLPN